MKYNIFDYNQKKAIELGLDLKDLLILNWIQIFYPKMNKTIRDSKQYFWVKYSAVLSDIPILEIESEKGLYKRMQKMCDIGILEYLPIRTSQGCFAYYLITELIAELVLSHSSQSSSGSSQSSDAIIYSNTINNHTIDSKKDTASGFSESENPTVKESLTVQKPKKEMQITKKEDIESFIRNFKANEFEVNGAIQFQSIFSENEIELITGYLLRRKEKHKSKAKCSQQAIKAILNKILEIKGIHALEVVFEQHDGCYVNCGTAGDPTTPWIRLELEYFTKLIKKPTFNNQYAKPKMSTTSQVAEMFRLQAQYMKNNEQTNNEEYECPF